MSGKVLCNCPTPPGGVVECDEDCIAICQVIGGNLHATCERIPESLEPRVTLSFATSGRKPEIELWDFLRTVLLRHMEQYKKASPQLALTYDEAMDAVTNHFAVCRKTPSTVREELRHGRLTLKPRGIAIEVCIKLPHWWELHLQI